MANEELVKTVKQILAAGRSGKLDDSYDGYRALFESPDFTAYEPADQRQALKIMILAKGAPRQPTPAMIEAHRAALGPLTELVSLHSEPSDHELLGVCHVLLGNMDSADRIFRAGLNLERERDASSDLVGTLMKRISQL